MKKIKSILQLREEKKLIKQRQAALEDKIRSNWNELKENLKPVNIAKEAIENVLHKKAAAFTNDRGFIKSALSYGITLLGKKLAEKAGEKLSKIFRKQTASGEQAS